VVADKESVDDSISTIKTAASQKKRFQNQFSNRSQQVTKEHKVITILDTTHSGITTHFNLVAHQNKFQP